MKSKKYTILIILAVVLICVGALLIFLNKTGKTIVIKDGAVAIEDAIEKQQLPNGDEENTDNDTNSTVTQIDDNDKTISNNEGSIGNIDISFPETNDPAVKAKQARIRELIQEVFSLRDYYKGSISSLEAQATAEYKGLPAEEHTSENKQAIANKYVNSAYSLENECDGRINAICSELEELLLETDGDFSIVNKVRYTYASEKASTKSELKSTYSDIIG